MVSYFGSDEFFDARIHQDDFLALSVGYELREWRYEELSEQIMSALTDFAFNYSETATINGANAPTKVKKAALAVYNSDKYRLRGEFGELLLHLVLRDYFNTVPAVSKMYYKDSQNDTIKGFDSVHIVETNEGSLQLWLGEVKFYKSISKAISDVVTELQKHANRDFLRGEFMFIGNKADPKWPAYSKFLSAIRASRSLDEIFTAMRIPVLLTYDSDVVGDFKEKCDEYISRFVTETIAVQTRFRKSKRVPKNIQIVLILVPLESKEKLVRTLHRKLEGKQK